MSKRAVFLSHKEYLDSLAPEHAKILRRVLALVRKSAPRSTAVISYGIPAFKRDRVFIYCAAFKRHVGIYPPVSGDARLQAALEPWSNAKGNLRFPFDEPLPLALIARLAKALAKQYAEPPRRQVLALLTPDKPLEKVILRGRKVVLEPLAASHLPGIARVIEDGKLYDIPFTFVPRPSELEQMLARSDAQFEASQALNFATIDIASGQLVGHTSFRNIERAHRRLEIGFTFIAQSWQRSHVNTEAKFLMLRHAFEAWGCLRVELLTDALNVASRAAILRIGAREEGILRNHMVMRDGRRRDSALYSIIDSEWPAVRQALDARIS